MLYRKKVAKKDYQSSKLPSNRLESIKDIISLQWMTLFKLGLVLLFFGLPLIIHQILLNISLYEIELAYQLGQISKSYAESATNETFNLAIFIRIGLLLFFGIGLSGVLRILRQLIWHEPIFFFSDIKKGIKSHIFYVSLSMLIIGVSYYIFHMIVRQGYFLEDTNQLTIQIVLSIILLITAVMLSFFVIGQTTLYQLNLFSMYKNALLYMMRYFFPSFGLMLILSVIWLILLIPLESFFLLVFALLFIVSPFGLLILMEYIYDIFDQTINQTNYKSIYKKGIHHE